MFFFRLFSRSCFNFFFRKFYTFFSFSLNFNFLSLFFLLKYLSLSFLYFISFDVFYIIFHLFILIFLFFYTILLLLPLFFRSFAPVSSGSGLIYPIIDELHLTGFQPVVNIIYFSYIFYVNHTPFMIYFFVLYNLVLFYPFHFMSPLIFIHFKA